MCFPKVLQSAMVEYLLYFQLFALVNALLATRYGERLADWLEQEEADAAKRQEEGRAFIQRANAEAAERDRLRTLANREMDRLARLRKEAAAARPRT